MIFSMFTKPCLPHTTTRGKEIKAGEGWPQSHKQTCPSSAPGKAYDPSGRVQCHHRDWRQGRAHWHWSAVLESPKQTEPSQGDAFHVVYSLQRGWSNTLVTQPQGIKDACCHHCFLRCCRPEAALMGTQMGEDSSLQAQLQVQIEEQTVSSFPWVKMSESHITDNQCVSTILVAHLLWFQGKHSVDWTMSKSS